MINPFNPQYKSNQNVTAADPAAFIIINEASDQVRVVNYGSNVAYVCTYAADGTILVADDTDLAVFGGQDTTFTKPLSHNRLSYFSPLGSTLSVMTGKGIWHCENPYS